MLVILSKCHPIHHATDSIIYFLLNCLKFAYLRPCDSGYSVFTPLPYYILETRKVLINYGVASK